MEYVKSTAVFSRDNLYRFALFRQWEEVAVPTAAFIGLNPSTADEKIDDPTIRRCVGFAKSLGCGSMYMLNIFAYRATDPMKMRKHHDPIGDDNDIALAEYARQAKYVIACWGIHGNFLSRGIRVARMLKEQGIKVECFGTTGDGNPKHPLYLKSDTPLIPY